MAPRSRRRIAAHLPLPDLAMDGHGMYALSDPKRMREPLEAVGWQDDVTIAAARAVDAVRDALSMRHGSDGVRLGSAVSQVTARR